MKRKSKKPGGETGINVIPVLGLAFILLLFVVVGFPFNQERGIGFGLGGGWGHWGCDPIFIEVDKDNRIFVDEVRKPKLEEGGRRGTVQHKMKQVDVRAVKNFVARGLAENPNCAVLVQAHGDADMGTVVRVVDQAKLARDRPPVPVSVATVD